MDTNKGKDDMGGVEGAPSNDDFLTIMKASYGGTLPTTPNLKGDHEVGEPKGAEHFEANKEGKKSKKGPKQLTDEIGKKSDGTPVYAASMFLKSVYTNMTNALRAVQPTAYNAYKKAKTDAGNDRDGKIAAYVGAVNAAYDCFGCSEICEKMAEMLTAACETLHVTPNSKPGKLPAMMFKALMEKYYVSGL